MTQALVSSRALGKFATTIGPLSEPASFATTVTNVTTAGAATYTKAAVEGRIITRDPASGARTDVLPSAADMIDALGLKEDGDTGWFLLVNTADDAEAITLGGTPTGVTYANAGQTLAQNESAVILVRRTGAAAATVYIVGA